MENKSNIIIYHTADGKASVALYAKDGMVWMNQNQLAELFDTSVPNISMQLTNILKECELSVDNPDHADPQIRAVNRSFLC